MALLGPVRESWQSMISKNINGNESENENKNKNGKQYPKRK